MTCFFLKLVIHKRSNLCNCCDGIQRHSIFRPTISAAHARSLHETKIHPQPVTLIPYCSYSSPPAFKTQIPGGPAFLRGRLTTLEFCVFHSRESPPPPRFLYRLHFRSSNPNGAVDIQPFSPHRFYSHQFFALTAGFSLEWFNLRGLKRS
ncbi:hypothetical protein AVEN_61420-1 [Araneus ventricosus]|uniref:Uncharacterized protein n=1 Tax=Araneus ventricosus TaxID=182803 RepID=A0A4Y2MJI3_ARAVE|nr:hypothetical protein AVEN_61420-1 [Araneus ventricosus]